MFDSHREGGTQQDDQSDNIDHGEVQYRVVSSQILVRDNGPYDWRYIAPELEELIQSRGTALAKAYTNTVSVTDESVQKQHEYLLSLDRALS